MLGISPFWMEAPVLEAVPAPSPPVAALAAEPGWRLSGLRLMDGAVVLKVEHCTAAVQLHVADGAGFDTRAGDTRAEEPRYLDTKQAAAYLGLSVKTLEKLRVTGKGPRYAKAGRRVIYDRRDLDKWVAERKRGFTGESVDANDPGPGDGGSPEDGSGGAEGEGSEEDRRPADEDGVEDDSGREDAEGSDSEDDSGPGE